MTETAWKLSELGEAAYLAFRRSLVARAEKYGKTVPSLPDWEGLRSAERAAWGFAAKQVAAMVAPLDEGGTDHG